MTCKLCSHHDIDITFNGVAPYSGSVRYKGKVEEYSRTQEVLLDNVNYKGTVSYKDTLKYQDIEVPYKGSHEVTCQDHHSCACDKLASLVLEAKALYEDIEYYRQVMTLQKQYLKSAPEDKETLPSPASSFSLDETNLLEGKREHKALTDIIHQKLKKVHTFEAEYKGTAQYTVPIRLPETKVPYTALIPYDRTIEYKDEVPYSGTVPYSGSTYYSTTYRVKSCYDPCGWCEGNVVSINKTYSDTVQYSGITAYAGKQKINEQVKCKGTTKHEGSITYSDVVEHKGSLPYSGTHKVSCEHDHHDCSCETYASWVSGLTDLLKAKEEYRSIIENLKTTLTQVTLEN